MDDMVGCMAACRSHRIGRVGPNINERTVDALCMRSTPMLLESFKPCLRLLLCTLRSRKLSIHPSCKIFNINMPTEGNSFFFFAVPYLSHEPDVNS